MAAVIGLISAPPVHSQPRPVRLTFEVASIKPAQSGSGEGVIRPMPAVQGYSAQAATVKLMISIMYKVPLWRITGGPEWLDAGHFDIEAKADRACNLDDLHLMFQNLLADRFQLKFHKENREGSVYALTVDKSGPKMKLNQSPEAENPPDLRAPINPGKDGVIIGTRVSMQYLCWWLAQVLQRDERPVIDKTGLDKTYDFALAYAPEFPPDFPKERIPPALLGRPSIFDALKEQLGLKLQTQKGPVEYYVIDHAEKPADN